MKPFSRQLGGWDLLNEVKDPRTLFKVTIYTSIDSWNEWVLARDWGELHAWIEVQHPDGFYPGFEPTIEEVIWGMDSVHMVL